MAEKKVVQLSEDEKAAMKERLDELKAGKAAEGEGAVLAKISEMPEPDRSTARRIHEIVKAAAPGLKPRTWYGMPAWAAKDGKVVCFFQGAAKFSARYSTFGFNDSAKLDDGNMWPASFALKELTPAEEARISALVKKAVS
ncbi:protein of unknown function (DUF1801) [Dehalogenimonas alkenigignens]|uniref:YdhG-like domain-containing protein n=1 Tax=Dehalogenimonas alkenigignens TaxID=1217799 RepID=A0A0W0GKV2_9CHLR|nr:DUF1801 domain-containing protein [Dehalogenimonas alkenigignens]KTB49170.1 protein of unknown function (DUF1801) [Dehalogenimonas alkenigignens]